MKNAEETLRKRERKDEPRFWDVVRQKFHIEEDFQAFKYRLNII